MTKVYYKRLRNAALPALGILMLCANGNSQQSSPPMKASVLDAHEGMTVGLEPWTSPEQYKQAFPKNSPYSAGIVAIRISFRNDTNESIRIGLSRIRMTLNIDENDRQELLPLTSEELADAVLKPAAKGPSSPRTRLPIPLPSSKGGRDKKWVELKKAAEDAGLHTGVVAPHTAADGLLYFDLRGQFDLLNSARIYIPDLVALESNRTLMYFELDLGTSPTR